MPNLSNALLDGFLAYIFRGVAMPAVTGPLVLSLHTDDPGDDRSHEVSVSVWTNYQRKTLARDTTDWGAPGADDTAGRKIANAVEVDFGTAEIDGTPPVITHVSVWDSETTPGPLFVGNFPLPTPKTIDDGDPVTIPIGALVQRLTTAAAAEEE